MVRKVSEEEKDTSSRRCSMSHPKLLLMLFVLYVVDEHLPSLMVTGFNNNNNGNDNFHNNLPLNKNHSGEHDNNNDDSDDQLHEYSLSQHVSFDPTDDKLSISAETEAVAFFGNGQKVPSSSRFSGENESSIINALFCSGGSDSQTFVAVAECRLDDGTTHGEFDSDIEEDDDESDDEDDNDDDGHGMMLSNASLRRSLVAANGGSAEYPSSYSSNKNYWSEGQQMRRRDKEGFSKSKITDVSSMIRDNTKDEKPTYLSKIISIRGGATAQGSEFAKRLLVAALVTLLYEGAMGHLLEFVKIVMQTSPPGTTYTDVLRTITAEKGIAGIWDGFMPWGVIQAVGKGGVFGLAHSVALSYLRPLSDKGVMPELAALTLAGGIAGGFQGYVLSPTLLLKTRVMTNPVFREKMSMLKTTLLSLTIGFDVVTNEGILALMKGSNIFATKRVFDWATRFFFSDMFEQLMLKHTTSTTLSPGEKITASLLGGVGSTLSTLPLDVLVAKTQDAKKAGVKVSAISFFRQELEEKGWKGLKESCSQGFQARLLHVCLTTVAMKTGTAFMYDALFKEEKA